MKRIRFDRREMHEDRAEELVRWTQGLGVEPDEVLGQGAIVIGKSSYELHLRKVIRDGDGRMVVDAAGDCVATTPLVVDLGQDKSWPQWLGDPDRR